MMVNFQRAKIASEPDFPLHILRQLCPMDEELKRSPEWLTRGSRESYAPQPHTTRFFAPDGLNSAAVGALSAQRGGYLWVEPVEGSGNG